MMPVDDPVRSVATFEPVMATPGHSLRQLAVAMTEAGCGALLVPDEDGRLAIVSERDLARALAGGADPDDAWAADIMTREVLQVDAEESIADAAEVMMEAGVRHLAVLDEENDRIGIVSLRDLLEPLLDSLG